MAERDALVVAGAGARGAYEAGALSRLLPEMETEGATPELLFGTSAGALNVVGLAAFADDGMASATEQLVAMWKSVTLRQVAPVLRSAVADVIGYAGQLALPSRVHLTSLLDTSRLADTVRPLIPWDRLHENVQSGRVKAVAVAATSSATQGTVVFVEKHRSVRLPKPDDKRNVTYVETELTVEHALASAAIPVAFRPVRVEDPAGWGGWYLDGGTRLNVPIKPAIAFGARRVAVVSTQAMEYPRPSTQPPGDQVGGPPDMITSAAQLLHGALADRMVEDLHTLQTVNALVKDRTAHSRGPSRRPLDVVEFLFAGPDRDQEGELGRRAEQAYRRLGRAAVLRNPALWLLSRLIGGPRAAHGELLSYLFFDPEFTGPAAELGAQHAAAAAGPPLRWQT